MDHTHDISICFSEADGEFAQILEMALTHYRLPKAAGLGHRHLHIFFDSPELNGTDYAELIVEQLCNSRKMIVVCSPESRHDVPFNHKIRTFITENGLENLVAVRATQAEEDPGEWLPEALAGIIPPTRVIPFDRINFARPRLSRRCPRAWHHLLAHLLDLDDATVAHIEAVQEQIWKKQRMALLVGLPLLLVVLSGGYWWFSSRSAGIEARTQAAEKNRQQAKVMLAEERVLPALHLLAGALAMNPPAALREDLLKTLTAHWPVARLRAILSHPAPVTGARFDAAAGIVVTLGADGAVRFWNLRTGEQLPPRLLHDGPVSGLKILANRRRILSWSEDGTVRQWHWPDGRPLTPPLSHSSPVLGVCLSPDSSRLISWCEDFRIHVWEIETGQRLGTAHHQGWVGGAAFDATAGTFFTWSDDSTVRWWTLPAATPVGTVLRHNAAVNGALLHPEGKRLLTWSNDSTARQWDIRTARRIGPPLRHRGAVSGARYHPDGRTLLTWSKDQTARWWDAGSGQEIHRFPHDGWVFGALFHPRQHQVLTWSFDNSAKLWNLESGKMIGAPMTHPRPAGGKPPGIFHATLSGDGTRLLTADGAQAVQLWNLSGERKLAAVFLHSPGNNPSHHPTGFYSDESFSTILTWAADSTVKVWEITAGPFEPKNVSARNAPEIIRALTGTGYDRQRQEVQVLPPEDWRRARRAAGTALSSLP